MGIVSSRFRRHKSKAELLDILETGIRKNEIDRQNNDLNRKRVSRYSIITAIVIYVVLIILNLCRLVHDLVIMIYPVIAIIMIIVISKMYKKALMNSQYKLYMMREEKKKLLEEVKITETYMVAKEILEKYGSSEDLLNQSKSA